MLPSKIRGSTQNTGRTASDAAHARTSASLSRTRRSFLNHTTATPAPPLLKLGDVCLWKASSATAPVSSALREGTGTAAPRTCRDEELEAAALMARKRRLAGDWGGGGIGGRKGRRRRGRKEVEKHFLDRGFESFENLGGGLRNGRGRWREERGVVPRVRT